MAVANIGLQQTMCSGNSTTVSYTSQAKSVMFLWFASTSKAGGTAPGIDTLTDTVGNVWRRSRHLDAVNTGLVAGKTFNTHLELWYCSDPVAGSNVITVTTDASCNGASYTNGGGPWAGFIIAGGISDAGKTTYIKDIGFGTVTTSGSTLADTLLSAAGTNEWITAFVYLGAGQPMNSGHAYAPGGQGSLNQGIEDTFSTSVNNSSVPVLDGAGSVGYVGSSAGWSQTVTAATPAMAIAASLTDSPTASNQSLLLGSGDADEAEAEAVGQVTPPEKERPLTLEEIREDPYTHVPGGLR